MPCEFIAIELMKESRTLIRLPDSTHNSYIVTRKCSPRCVNNSRIRFNNSRKLKGYLIAVLCHHTTDMFIQF